MTFSALQIFIFELLKFGFHMTFMYAKKILFSKDEIFLEGQKNLKKKNILLSFDSNLISSKLRERFFQILCPSHNI